MQRRLSDVRRTLHQVALGRLHRLSGEAFVEADLSVRRFALNLE